MVTQGFVQNGVVVLEEGVRLPEGQRVTVVATMRTEAAMHSILDIPAVSLGGVASLSSDDDLLGQLLEDRK